jgi:hypothetical protein
MPTSKLQWDSQPGKGTSTYAGGLYCGPGWGFTKEDVISGKIKELPKAIDAIDEACAIHDQCYQDFGYFSSSCNEALALNLVKIIKNPKSTAQQRLDAVIMAAIFHIEAKRIDPIVSATKYSYSCMKIQIDSLWKSGNRTLGQVINQVAISNNFTNSILTVRIFSNVSGLSSK